ncbi:hypothetical protein [Thauera linaloolentis]|uniref:Uncharacterized protein n=1 Tax=Thauera linaloolentis (strain DSM 12138 / JCM 21573 / CCUG 41526 / CIP 105981 / IAM 15112 / NBRC 102519 / 47Lol) TaxID=1123367 RepID=N6Y8C0_THAL4|nr:hypothetical protein [Thauera linaloolentis]ENO90521.1 hypothetical protein C666_01415 [Thauera linaloolentis 47Lol = DSM 12138]MCM8566380.1 hypothetical protein [Thauera linaloolentis]
MSAHDTAISPDPLAVHADSQTQRQAAHMAQEAFARVFRLSVGEADEARLRGVAQLHRELDDWACAGADDEARALRRALLLSGMDQWGVAWSQAFGLLAIPGLTELIGALRTGLDAPDEARFLRQFEAIGQAEENAIDFKVELRRGVHLALWHSSIATQDRDEALRLASQLGGRLLGLMTREMPVIGWRLVADALAFIQIRCLADGLASEGVGQEATQALFGALARELPQAQRDRVMAHAARAVIAWQQASRSQGQVH